MRAPLKARSTKSSDPPRCTVSDESRLPIECTACLTSEATDVAQALATSAASKMVTRQLPSGTYRHDITRPGFATYVGMVEVGVALPTRVRVALGVASLSSGLTVTPDARLLDHVSATF